MKTTRLLSFVMLLSIVGLKANAQDVKKYNYCYAYSYDTKMLWVSNIVSAIEHHRSEPNKIYMPPNSTALYNQWNDKLKTILQQSDYLKMTVVKPSVWFDYDRIDEERTKTIGKFKQEGFQIYFVKDMRYRQDKYDRR
jgi:hypothetical protein